MNIVVIGIGGVGGYFGGKLCQMLQDRNDLEVHFIARGRHQKEIQKKGLLLDTDDGVMLCTPTSATDRFSDLPALDLCLLSVKSFDLDRVLPQLQEKISEQTTLLPLLNGVDIYERIRRHIKTGVVFPSCVYVSARIEREGKVTQRGDLRTIIFGKDPHNDLVDERIFDLFSQARIKYEWHENPYISIWSKFIFIASYSLVTANFDKTIGEVLASESLSSTVVAIMRDIEAIARKKDIPLPENIVSTSFERGQSFPPETKTSFQRNYEDRSKPDEREIFGGAIIHMADRLGIAAETTRDIYQSLEAHKPLNAKP